MRLLMAQLPLLVRSLAGTSCFSTMKHRAHMDGDVMIAGFFPLYTLGTDRSNSDASSQAEHKPFIFKNYQLVLALAFAMEEINKNPDLLHNLTLGFDVYDVHHEYWGVFKNHFIWLFGKYTFPNYSCMRERKSIAALTGPLGIRSAEIGTVMELYRFPQLTFGPFDHALSDHKKSPALYQMSKKDTSIAAAMVSLLLHFSWNWVGLLTSQDENGLWIISELKGEMIKNRVCIAYELLILSQASESDCVTWDSCPPDTSLDWLPGHMFDMTMSADSYTIYNSVYALAQALHEMLLHQTQEQAMGNGEGTVPFAAQLHHFLKNIQFYNPAGDQVIMDENKKLEPEYDILNIWNFPEGLELGVKIGMFSPYALHGNQLSLSEDMVEWTIGITEKKKFTILINGRLHFSPDMEQCVRCADHQYANTQRDECLLRAASFLAFGDPLGMALACMALCFSMLTAAVLGLFVKHQDTAIVKANNRTLSYILLISLIFCFLCALLFIGRPNTATCILQQITFGVVFTVAVSTVLAKTVTVVLAFKATCPGRRMRWLLVSGAPNLLIPICTLIQVSLCGLWLGSSPPFVDTDAHSEHGHIIILCNKGSLTAFYCVLGYLGSLALASFTVAFLARNLPDTFNEAKFLTFSMLVFCSVWLTFLPVYHSAKGKVMVAVEVFSILASGAGLLGCIFAPKCYNVLLKADRNFLRGYRDKRHGAKP
ncbi:vomeronasal type-2 receptor 116-like [Thomomys bottae]